MLHNSSSSWHFSVKKWPTIIHRDIIIKSNLIIALSSQSRFETATCVRAKNCSVWKANKIIGRQKNAVAAAVVSLYLVGPFVCHSRRRNRKCQTSPRREPARLCTSLQNWKHCVYIVVDTLERAVIIQHHIIITEWMRVRTRNSDTNTRLANSKHAKIVDESRATPPPPRGANSWTPKRSRTVNDDDDDNDDAATMRTRRCAQCDIRERSPNARARVCICVMLSYVCVSSPSSLVIITHAFVWARHVFAWAQCFFFTLDASHGG